MDSLLLALAHAIPVVLAGLTTKRWRLHATGVAMCVIGVVFGTPAFALYDLGAIAIAWVGMAMLISSDERYAAGKRAESAVQATKATAGDHNAARYSDRQAPATPVKPAGQASRGDARQSPTPAEASGRPSISASEPSYRQALPPGFPLGTYRVVRTLGIGGFGVTYLCEHAGLGVQVAVKEYLPNEIAVRDGTEVHPKSAGDRDGFEWGLSRFLDEARTLARFEHPNVVRVRDRFEANNTAYIVMDYEDGEPLDALLRHHGTLTEAQLKRVVLPVADGLRQVHAAGFLHRDIKPSNVFVRRSDESPVLLDFGSARQALGRRSRSMTAIASAGYSPPEQYERDGAQGAWTDIYALSALCYRAITGNVPMEALSRQRQLLRTRTDPLPKLANARVAGYSSAFLEAVDWGLRVVETERPQDLEEWSRGWHRGEHVRKTNHGEVETQHSLGDLYYLGKRRPKDAGMAAMWYRKAAEQGHARAQASLGSLYRRGDGVPRDAGQAAKWYGRAAEQGHARAQFNLGLLYDRGDGVPKDAGQAASWYRRAAAQGHAKARHNLAALYDRGDVPKDAG